ncbi:MAG TPA: DGQHR domain-containing protein [Blastocatellia bacterium]|nr:DGQHR domain-containing protein [Blastocatellia bacterium]
MKKSASEKRCFFGFRVKQRVDTDTVSFFVFFARAKDIKQWTGIKRSAEFPEGIQRILRPSRKKAITRFLASNPMNTIPNNILLAFEPTKTRFGSLTNKMHKCIPKKDILNKCKGQLDWGFLEFSFNPDEEEHLRPALIVDGQHRLYGISAYNEEDLPLLVVSLIDAPLQEQAFQFIVINSKAVRVQADNAKAIIADLSQDVEDELRKRLLNSGVKYGDQTPLLITINDLPTSPFQKLLKWSYNREGIHLVELTTIEQATSHIRALFARYLEDDEDSLIEIFCAIWRAVKASYPELWGKEKLEGETNKFMTKVNINALNEFIADRLKIAHEMGFLKNIFESKEVENIVSNVFSSIPKEFWEAKWKKEIKIQDNANVRRMIKEDLETLMENTKLKRQWNEDLKLTEDATEDASQEVS